MPATKVLFLCTGNSARSQMAEAFLRKLGVERFEAFSAGLEPSEINPMTFRVMSEIGIDLEGQRSKDLTEYMGKMHFGHLITVCSRAQISCPAVFPGMGKRHHWDIEDPAAAVGTGDERLEVFRRVRDELKARVESFIESQEG